MSALIAAGHTGQISYHLRRATEEVAPEDWAERVYRPDIAESADRLYKKPGYTVRDLDRI